MLKNLTCFTMANMEIFTTGDRFNIEQTGLRLSAITTIQ